MEFLLRSKDMINHADKAKELFEQGYNCAQAVLLAFEDVTGLDTETAAKLSSSFGGGMGRMRADGYGHKAGLLGPDGNRRKARAL